MLGRGTGKDQLAMRDDSAQQADDKNNVNARSSKHASSPAVFPSEKHVHIGSVLLSAMARFARRNPEVLSLFLTAVFSVLVSKLAQDGGATQSPAVPPPIFPKDSPVYEFTDGNMENAMLQIRTGTNEFSFVMYYAHWDGNSRDIAVEFDKAARKLSHQVTFIAVNCWWMHGSCRQQIQTQMYPALLVTVPSLRNGLQFTGIYHADEMLSFLHQICSPFTYITDTKALFRLHAQHGTLIVGYFESRSFPSPPGLASFQKAAWLAIEKDPIDPIAFAVVTDIRLARSLGFDRTGGLAIVRSLNSTMFYPKDAKFKGKSIAEWAYRHRESVIQWLAPAGVKSTIMASQISGSPAVVMLTPHDQQLGLTNNFYLLKEVALDYYNCKNSRHIRTIINTINQGRASDQENCCDDESADEYLSNDCDCCQTLADIPITMASSHGRNVCQVCEQSSGVLPHSCKPSRQHSQATMLNLVHGMASLVPNSCLHMNYYYSPYSRLQLCCMQCDAPHQHMCCQNEQCAFSKGSTSDADCHQVPDLTNCPYECTQTLKSTGGKKQWTSASSTKTSPNPQCSRTLESQNGIFHAHLGSFSGLGCRTNRTVNFFAMRSEYFWVFAKQLGVANISDFENRGEKALVLLDMEAEQQHFLDEAVTTTAIKHFILNYTMSNLTRHLRSLRHSKPSICSQSSSICVQEVISSTFEELVLDNNKDVLLLYYAPWCGFCKRMHHVYLTLAKVFQKSSNLLIARIDGDANDLPWHLTHSSYPALLMFPAGRKDRSQRFPTSTTLNLPNMIKFVLQHMTSLP